MLTEPLEVTVEVMVGLAAGLNTGVPGGGGAQQLVCIVNPKYLMQKWITIALEASVNKRCSPCRAKGRAGKTLHQACIAPPPTLRA